MSWSFLNSDGTPFNLAAYAEIHMQVRKKAGDPVVFEGTLTDGEFSKTSNVVSLAIQIPDDIFGRYQFDIDLIKADGEIWTPIFGTINIRKQITIQTA